MVSLIPGRQLPEHDIQYLDLIVHFIMYGLLTLAIISELKQFLIVSRRLLLWVFISVILYGGIIEIVQEKIIDGRFGSISDFFANTSGSLFAALTMQININKREK